MYEFFPPQLGNETYPSLSRKFIEKHVITRLSKLTAKHNVWPFHQAIAHCHNRSVVAAIFTRDRSKRPTRTGVFRVYTSKRNATSHLPMTTFNWSSVQKKRWYISAAAIHSERKFVALAARWTINFMATISTALPVNMVITLTLTEENDWCHSTWFLRIQPHWFG